MAKIVTNKEVTEQWDERGTPPVIGKNKEGIVKSFKKLKSNPADYWEKDLSGDEESLGIIQNFNKDTSVVNQFFPTMLKTKISIGKSWQMVGYLSMTISQTLQWKISSLT